MPAEERKPEAVASYDYFRLLQALRDQGFKPRTENNTSLAFPASDIAAHTDDAVRPAFMGFLGAAGALPYHYTERIASVADSGPREFLDMLSSRVLEQFDAAWHKHRPERQELVAMMMALGGIQDAELAQYAALTRRRAISAEALGRAMSEYFGVPMCVQQFVGSWQALAPQHRCTLGQANATLGSDTALGERQWLYDHGIEVHVGPLEEQAYEQFLPQGAAAMALSRMLAVVTAGCVEAVARVQLAPASMRAASLDARARLGYDAFLAKGLSGELCYKIGTS